MVKLTTIMIGFIIASAASLVLINVATDFTLNYGITETALMNTSGFKTGDNGNVCSANNLAITIRNLNSLFQNNTVDSGTYAPGQINAPVGENMVTATQSSGLVSILKATVAPFTIIKALMTDMGCALGIPPIIILAFQIAFVTSILFLIAGIFNFRPW